MNTYTPEQFSRKPTNYKVSDVKRAVDTGEILEGVVTKCDNNMNVQVNICPNVTGIISADDFAFNPDGKPLKSVAVLSKVGKVVKFKVTSVDRLKTGMYVANLSRRLAQEECYNNYISKLQPGQVIDTRVTYLENYGAFCDIGCGFTALLPIENICIPRINDPKHDLAKMRNIKAVVKSIDDSGRITLTHKELLGTWEEEASKFSVGDTVVGIVRIKESYGIFVEISQNLVGLADIYPDVECGDEVAVYIKAIVPEKMKVKLLIINKNDKLNKAIHYNYRLPESGFVYDWVYSPESSDRRFETHIPHPDSD